MEGIRRTPQTPRVPRNPDQPAPTPHVPVEPPVPREPDVRPPDGIDPAPQTSTPSVAIVSPRTAEPQSIPSSPTHTSHTPNIKHKSARRWSFFGLALASPFLAIGGMAWLQYKAVQLGMWATAPLQPHLDKLFGSKGKKGGGGGHDKPKDDHHKKDDHGGHH